MPTLASFFTGPLSLEPLANAAGAIRAEIVDARLGFDADVTVPIRQGWIHFNDATVEHVVLFDRTAIQGEVRLGDGKFTAPGVQVTLAGRPPATTRCGSTRSRWAAGLSGLRTGVPGDSAAPLPG